MKETSQITFSHVVGTRRPREHYDGRNAKQKQKKNLFSK
jgi:hypothetical protein